MAITTEEFIKRARKLHGDKYDYSKVEYKNANAKVCIICPIHGEFWQTPSKHTNCKHGCPKCGSKERLSNDEFIKRAREIHGDKYDYSKVDYKNNRTKVLIKCKICATEWESIPTNHLRGQGCPVCARHYLSQIFASTTEEFIKRAREIHDDKYDYSKVEYKNAQTKVCIICPVHGEFWQTPHKHINGKHGCPKCRQSKLEEKIELSFIKNKISFTSQKTFDWLTHVKSLYLDFYLQEYNIAIECQGGQHFESVEHFGGQAVLEQIKQRDKKKKELCEAHGIKMLYFADKKYNEEIIIDEDMLIEKIKSCKSY